MHGSFIHCVSTKYDHSFSFLTWIKHPSLIWERLKGEQITDNYLLRIQGDCGQVQVYESPYERVYKESLEGETEILRTLLQGLVWFKSKLTRREWRKKCNIVWKTYFVEEYPVFYSSPDPEEVKIIITPKIIKSGRKKNIWVKYNFYQNVGEYTYKKPGDALSGCPAPPWEDTKVFTGKELLKVLDLLLKVNGEDNCIEQYERNPLCK
jgi:hypothetical protein